MNPTIYPGIDASLRLGSHWKLHASYNTSLRMPSFTEMYYKLQGYKADPHLKPEEMSAVELGASLHQSPFALHLALWHHHGRNMIDWIMDTRQGDETAWQSVNHTRLNSVGLETSASLSIPTVRHPSPYGGDRGGLQLSISYSYIHQEKDLESGIVSQYALEYLRHKLVANIHIPLLSQSGVLRRCRSQIPSRLTLDATLRYQDRAGQYTDFDGSVNDYRPYALVDARLSWQHPAYELYLKANNLLNTSYRDYGLVPQPGRWLIAGLCVAL